jgi:23S rRNA (uracil1939-C5)-methyltransferase
MGNAAVNRIDGAIELGTVVALTHEGEGVVRDGKTAFVAGALPGERIRYRRTRRHRQHDDGQLLEVLEPSAERVVPRCAHFGLCGGCSLQHLAADSQLAIKQAELREGLEKIARVAPETWLPPLHGPQWGYRRRARLGAKYVFKKGRGVVGFRERLAPYIAALERCEVLAPPAGELIEPLSALLTSLDIRERLPQIEVAVADNAVALVLRVLADPTAADLAKFHTFESAYGVRLYLQRGGLDTVRRLEPALPDETPLHYALPAFQLELEFTPTDFIQVNGAVNAALVERAVELLGVGRESRVLDLYCGLGNFTLALARRAGSVVGVEGDAQLIERARHNARRNGVENAEFQVANLAADVSPQTGWLRQTYSHVLLDPPRAGAREMLPTVARFAPRRVLYISCHPGSLARDIGILVHDHGFKLRAAGVLDMFPHTSHVESIAVLEPG